MLSKEERKRQGQPGSDSNANLEPLGDRAKPYVLFRSTKAFFYLQSTFLDHPKTVGRLRAQLLSHQLHCLDWSLKEEKRLPKRNRNKTRRNNGFLINRKLSNLTKWRNLKDSRFWAKKLEKDNLWWLEEWSCSTKRLKVKCKLIKAINKYYDLKYLSLQLALHSLYCKVFGGKEKEYSFLGNWRTSKK